MKKILMFVGCFCFVLLSFGAAGTFDINLKKSIGLESENSKVENKLNGAAARLDELEIEEGTKPDPITIYISVVPDYMKFDVDTFTVVAGQEVILELENTDFMQHNLLISEPGTLETVGEAADLMARDPNAAQKEYVPEIPEILYATKMLEPGDFATIEFTAPSEPGDYPYVCTFPGHWRMMNGVMVVTEK